MQQHIGSDPNLVTQQPQSIADITSALSPTRIVRALCVNFKVSERRKRKEI